MTESNDDTSGPDPENPSPSADKPNVPVPPPPAGSPGGQIHTHGEDSPGVMRSTEDIGTKSKE